MSGLEQKELAARAWGYVIERREGLLHNEPGMPPRLALEWLTQSQGLGAGVPA